MAFFGTAGFREVVLHFGPGSWSGQGWEMALP